MHVFLVDDSEWIVAETPERALEVAMVALAGQGMTPDDIAWGSDPEPPDVERYPDDRVIGMDMDDGIGCARKTCAEWAADGERHLGSVNW
jgi:hypothetical protein